jgi:hypothetical protein
VRRKKKKKKKKKKKGVRREGGREWEEGAMAWSLAAPPYKIVSNSSLASWPIVNSGHAHFLGSILATISTSFFWVWYFY